MSEYIEILYKTAIKDRDEIGSWLSAALEDEKSCLAFRLDILSWMARNQGIIDWYEKEYRGGLPFDEKKKWDYGLSID